MAIFPNLELEREVQTDDKIRLDATKSFVSKEEASITLVEIEPESGSGFIDVTGSSSSDYFLDWSYSGSSRTVTVSCRITTDGSPVTFTKDIEVLTPADDLLFSDDQDLVALEQDILKWVKNGRNSFLNMHRKAQYLILERFNDLGVRTTDGDRVSKSIVLDVEDVKKWSQYLTLELIYGDLSNSVDDIFAQKRQFYGGKAAESQDVSFKKFLDLNENGSLENDDIINMKTMDLVRT